MKNTNGTAGTTQAVRAGGTTVTAARAAAEAAIKAAGYRVSTARGWFDATSGIGYAFSYECDRRNYGAAMMSVRFDVAPVVA